MPQSRKLSIAARLSGGALLLALSSPVLAQSLGAVRPEEVGFAPDRLVRVTQMVRDDVAKGRIAGAVLLVARKGKIAYFESFGMRDKDAGAPMGKDAIFRIYSMTKPLTSVAVMMLLEEGRFALNDPVSKYLPQLGKLKVGIERKDPQTGQVTLDLVDSRREMTIQDLMRHTSGLTYGVFGAGKVKDLYKEADVDTVDQTNAELVDRLGKLPLMFQPGTVWEYGRSTDVLGRLVEVVSGMTLGEFLDKRIIKPLGMSDSAFWVPADKLNRMAEPQAEPPENKKPVGLDITRPPKFEGGGQGLVATASDYARFLQMLLNGGELDGVRILSRKSVEFMTSNHLAAVAQTEGPAYLPGPGFGFGLGFAVRTSEGVATTLGSRGEFTWGGYFGTNFWVDPKEKLFVVWMTQSPYWRTLYPPLLRNMVLQSIADNGNAE